MNSAELKDQCEQLGITIETSDDVSVLAQVVTFNSRSIPNSLAIHPMEGCDGDKRGGPGELTLRRYKRFASGGAGLLWAEAIAVVEEARANPRQLWIGEHTRDDFKKMVDMIRNEAAGSMGTAHRPFIVAQLTHSGRYSKPDGISKPIIAQRDPYRDGLVPQKIPDANIESRISEDHPLATDAYLDRLQEAYVTAARLAYEAGFDAVDIKACHGYLINELLAGFNRKGKYGGSFENRVRFLLETIEKIKAELGDKIEIVTRLSVYDGVPYPFGFGVDKEDYTKADLTEPIRLIGSLQDKGVRLINITIANPYYNPHLSRPFNTPVTGGYASPEHPLTGVHRFIELTAHIQKTFPDIVTVGTGYTRLQEMMASVGAANKQNGNVTLVGAGRMAFAYPDFAKDILRDRNMDPQKVCICCSMCSQIMRNGGMTGCVVRDKEIYGPIYREGLKNE